MILRPTEHPDVSAWRTALAERFPASDIEEPFDLATPIYAAYQSGAIKPLTIRLRGSSESPRRYLGMSGLAAECPRRAWAQWRGLDEPFDGRLLRLFRTGDVYEERMRAELRAIGFEMSGDQSGFSAFGERVKGHTDGFARLADLPWALWEAKTANRRRTDAFKKLLREKTPNEALAKWDAKYYGQVQGYLAAFDLHVCLYGVTCKDTDEIVYCLIERDDAAVTDIGARALEILDAPGPPRRGYSRPRTPECTRFCEHVEWCWYEGELPRRCGTCTHWVNGACDLGRPLEVCDEYEAVPHADTDTATEWETL